MSKVPHNLYILPNTIRLEDSDYECPPPTSPETSFRIERTNAKLPARMKSKVFIEVVPRDNGACDDKEFSDSNSGDTGSESVKLIYGDEWPESQFSSSQLPFSTLSERSDETESKNTETETKNSRCSKESFVVEFEQIREICFPPVVPEQTAKITSSGSEVNLCEKILKSVYLKPRKFPSDTTSNRVVNYKPSWSYINTQNELERKESCPKSDLERKYGSEKLVVCEESPTDGVVCAAYEIQKFSTPKKSTASTNEKRERLQRESCSKRSIECDVMVVVEGRCFYSFSSVLCSSSTWFQTIFEDPANETSVIELPNMSAHAFDLVHKWMFSKDNRLITEENVVSVTQIAFQLRIPELLEHCLNTSKQMKIKLPRNIFTPIPHPNDPKPNLSLKQTPNKHRELVLEPRLFQRIIRCPEFFSLHINTLATLLSEDDLDVESEVEVFDAAVAWLSRDWANRVIHAPKLLHCVRFACLTNYELISIVYHDKNLPVLALPLCRDLILQSYLYWSACKSNLIRKLNVPLPSVVTRKRLRKKHHCMLGNWEAAIRIQAAWRGYRVRKCICIQDGAAAVIQAGYRGYLNRLWIKECLIPQMEMEKREKEEKKRRIKAAIIIQRTFRKYLKFKNFFKTTQTLMKKKCLDDCNQSTMLLIGGYDMTKSCDKKGQRCYLYELRKREWELISAIPEAVYYGKAAFIKNAVYVTGGSNLENECKNIHSLKSAWKWDLLTNKWTRIAHMNTSRTHHALVGAIDRIFAIGGSDENQNILNSVEMYEPDCDEWYEMSPMLCNRMGHSAVFCDNLIIVCGGIGLIDKPYGEILNSVEIYNPNTDKWTCGIDLRIPRCFSSLVECGSGLYLVGGISFAPQIKGSVSKIDKCDDCKSEWCPYIETNLPIHSAAAGVICSFLCVVGGLCSQLGGPVSSGSCYNVEAAKKVDDFDVSLPVKLTGMACVQVPLELATNL